MQLQQTIRCFSGRTVCSTTPTPIWGSSGMHSSSWHVDPHLNVSPAYTSVQALRHIAIGPPSAGGAGTHPSGEGYAMRNGITRVTVPAIAYTAVVVGEPARPIPHCPPCHRCTLLFQAMPISQRGWVGVGDSPVVSSTSASLQQCGDGLKRIAKSCCHGGAGMWQHTKHFPTS